MALLNSNRDRRKEDRYEVELAGRVECAGAWYDVVVSDLSPSGALIEVDGPQDVQPLACAASTAVTPRS